MPPILAFAWPILFFGDRVVPWRGTIRATGNDFTSLYYAYKAYLLDCLARFEFPWWSPNEGAGYPFYASPFTQAFYPLNAPLALFHALAAGSSAPFPTARSTWPSSRPRLPADTRRPA